MEKYLNKIIQGNCLELVKDLDNESLDAVIIDPPFGEGFSYAGDNNINSASILLNQFLRLIYPKLKIESHLAIFWTMRNVDICIEAIKKNYTFRRLVTMYIPTGEARPYLGWLPRTQAIAVGQKYIPCEPSELHWKLAVYLKNYISKLGYNNQSLSNEIGCSPNLIRKWTLLGNPQWCLPTPKFYEKLKSTLGLDGKFDFMLNRESVFTKAPQSGFPYHHDCYIVDDKKEKMKHPAQKPLSVIKHIVECVVPKDGVVLDAFAGSGTTALGALETGRNFIGFEISEQFCSVARNRIDEWKKNNAKMS